LAINSAFLQIGSHLVPDFWIPGAIDERSRIGKRVVSPVRIKTTRYLTPITHVGQRI
jgi:hypothetical protein